MLIDLTGTSYRYDNKNYGRGIVKKSMRHYLIDELTKGLLGPSGNDFMLHTFS